MENKIQVRFDEKDIDELRELAESKGLKLSTLIRMTMLKVLAKSKKI